MSELRRETRLRTFLKGRILFNNGNSSMDCLVRDLSGSGARLMLSQTATLPEGFDLYIPAKERTHKATLRWRREDSIGVTFAEETARAPAPEADPAALLARIQDLEAENASLRRQLREAEAMLLERTP
ncbi:PilZ domain-containing protein [Methylobacterium platani]|uniref:Pilus assembly protein PilZ n=2 Tax=Methylobacterium platani TaxID=427683 RepID=A0A179S6G5_9HYPH|nr:PilZ domain-containing protein [Methylobacterium platani]KMO20067.1 pilus assembly protein PilZ [Methylobacterium platani JCM 14648]OAS22855.1 pilus assembly protein PilZ [Methylobacterium platani]